MKRRRAFKEFWEQVKYELRENRKTFIVYSVLRLLVIVVIVLQVINRNWENVFLGIVTLALMIVPSVLQVTFKVEFPSLLEIVMLLFIFATEILGEIGAFYILIPNWDMVMHTLNGFFCAVIGFSLVDILNRSRRLTFDLSPFFMALVAFCFSMTIGVLWEFFEFAMDKLFAMDMQKDTVVHAFASTMLDPTRSNIAVPVRGITDVAVNGRSLGLGGYLDIGLIDTMEDLFVNFIGAVVFSTLGYFYVKYSSRRSKSLVERLVPTPQRKDKYKPPMETADKK